ncbi:creatininase family protein [Bosea sp. (in: a-proteobacteria)]|jgi:creatinine amidohydrolase|uniref:creatininase family protein n=1 Tax=Bosea sp. (in: a-proteobacteria) TaxID=1871050 RepID=UPI002DDD66A1|nr:creatininase family protein [Bosea sp. (in: a-proteobacteria)]HEV2511615.1 creatininase family protein [Bosea sp. (in: a-proteobacteria)]
MQLSLATWRDVEQYLVTSRGIIIPVGATEQHGPNGLIGTDHLDAEFIAKGVGDKIGAMVAPTLAYGMSQHHLGFAGSVTLRPSTMIAMVADIVRSLARHGFERFFFINGHAGNIGTMTAAFDEIYASLSLQPNGHPSPIRCRMLMWSDEKRASSIAEELYPGVNGAHATAAEVSLSQFYHPETVKPVEMSPEVAPPFAPFYDCVDFRTRYPDGRIGSAPSRSRPEHGERLFAAAVEDMVEAYQAFMA